MKKLILTLLAITFLFNNCSGPEVIEKEKLIYVYRTVPKLKSLNRIDIEVPVFQLYKAEYNGMYLVKKDDLVKASKSTQALRHKTFLQNKQISFYLYQNKKFNDLPKKDNK